MNERIQELAVEANDQTGNEFDLNYKELDAFLEKFAELIVRECAGVCDDLRDGTDYEFEKDMADNCAQAIMKRFGVD